MRTTRRSPLGRLTAIAAHLALACSAAAQASKPARPAVVYTCDFDKAVGPEWSDQRTDATPKGNRRFLGRLGAEEVSLVLKGLPAHRYVRVSVDLLIIQSWDGDWPVHGMDVWSLRVKDGPELMHCVFSNRSGKQTFPDELPGPRHPPMTGAAGSGTLGYTWKKDKIADSTYRLSCVFAHTDANVALVFAGIGLQKKHDESWGMDNVKVEAISAQAAPGPKHLAALWKQLADKDPVKACAAIEPLVLAGDAAIAAMPAAFRPPALDKKTAALIADLDNDDWRKRDKATKALKGKGPAIASLLRGAMRDTQSMEVKSRIESILDEFAKAGAPQTEPAEHYRALRVLALVRTPKALRAVKGLHAIARDQLLRNRAAAETRRIAAQKLRRLLADAQAHAAAGKVKAAAKAFEGASSLAGELGTGVRQSVEQIAAHLRAGKRPDTLWASLAKALTADRAQVAAMLKRVRAPERPKAGTVPADPGAPRFRRLIEQEVVKVQFDRD